MNTLMTWSVLVLTLPTGNATARMRFWRALKGKGCAVLRDGIYLLPYSPEGENMLRELVAAIGESGGAAHLLRAPVSMLRRTRNSADSSTWPMSTMASSGHWPKRARPCPGSPPPN